MDVDLRERSLDRDQHVPVGEGAHLRVDAALHADLGRTALDCFDDLGEHLVGAVVVGVALPALALKGAELAVHEADVREVHVAVDDVGDDVAEILGANPVGSGDEGAEVVARRPQQGEQARLVDAFAREPALDLARDRRARGRDQTFDGGAVG